MDIKLEINSLAASLDMLDPPDPLCVVFTHSIWCYVILHTRLSYHFPWPLLRPSPNDDALSAFFSDHSLSL
jgi:hypothetical protein